MSFPIAALETLIPSQWVRWLALASMLIWLGWQAQAIAGSIESHYHQMDQLLHTNLAMCKAVSKLAHTDPLDCLPEAN